MSAAAPTAAESRHAAPLAPRRILAVSLDLDDTLWPIAPAIDAAERALDAWLREHHPQVADTWPIDALRGLRERVALERPDLAHDYTAQRLITLERAFAACGVDDAPVADAFEAYFAARNRVDCYPDAIPALHALAARLPLASLSNGNADLARIGLRGHFRACISARDCGVAKPSAAIFHAACSALGVAPGELLHVGDDPWLDVAGAHAAGVCSAWLNRSGAAWPAHESLAGVRPDLELRDLGELVDWIHART